MNNRMINMIALTVLLVIMLSQSASAVCDIRKEGKTLATLDGSTFRRGGADLGAMMVST